MEVSGITEEAISDYSSDEVGSAGPGVSTKITRLVRVAPLLICTDFLALSNSSICSMTNG